MFGRLVLLSFVVCLCCWAGWGEDSDQLVTQLRNDANLDLSADEEYEDLRAELLAYHTAFASLASRRSMFHTACWQMGGVCMHWTLCQGGVYFRTQVPGCKDKLNVCCFAWNRFRVKDWRSHGIQNVAFPWTMHQTPFGGKGIIDAGAKGSEEDNSESDYKPKKRRNKKRGKKMSLNENKTKLTIVVAPVSTADEE